MTGVSAEAALAEFVTSLRWEDVPAETQRRVEVIWADTIANAYAGRAAANTSQIEQLVLAACGPGSATVVGGRPLAPTAAVFLNAFQITAYTMCDVYRPVLCHVTPEVVPVLLAAGEDADIDGRTALAALAAGLEVTVRVGLALDDDDHRRRRWHAPGVVGPFGAAAAAARVLGLDVDTLLGAWGLAGSQAAGTFVALGTSAVKFHQARGATSGLWATRFAADGFGGARRSITSPDGGLLVSHAGGGHPQRLLDELGARWHLDDIALRRWPAASSLQAVVESALALHHQHGLRPAAVDELHVRLPRQSYELCADKPWDDELLAMQSARYVPSFVLQDGRCWLDHYSEQARARSDVGNFAATRVQVHLDPTLPTAAAEVTAKVGDSEITERRDAPLGDPTRPVTLADTEEKFRAASASAGRADADDLWPRLHATAQESRFANLVTALGDPWKDGQPDLGAHG